MHRLSLRYALFLALLFLLAAPALPAPTPLPEPSSAKSLFKNRPFGPRPAPTPIPQPKIRDRDDGALIPASWQIGALIVAALGGIALLLRAARSWRLSNLFDREYRFPVTDEAAERLGAPRCGGHMATIQFDPPEKGPGSKTKDT